METLNFRRALILTAVALRDENLFWRICKTSNLRELSAPDTDAVQAVLEDVVCAFGYMKAEDPTLIADEVENCIGYLYRNLE